MPITDASEIHDRLREFAHLQAEYQSQIERLREEEKVIADKRRVLQNYLDEQEQEVRTDILDYMASTGDLHASPLVTFRRTRKLMYDKETALAYVQQNHREFLRVVESLDVRKFEAAVKNGELPDFDAEVVPAPTLEIHPLGELLLGDHS